MARNSKLDEAKRRLEAALAGIEDVAGATAPQAPASADGTSGTAAPASADGASGAAAPASADSAQTPAAVAAPAPPDDYVRVAPARRRGSALRSAPPPATQTSTPQLPSRPADHAQTVRLTDPGAAEFPEPPVRDTAATPAGNATLERAAAGPPADAPAQPEVARSPRTPAPAAAGPPADAPAQPEVARSPRAPAPASTSLVRLVVGAALLGLDGLAARSGYWEEQAGLEERRPAPPASEGAIGSGHFRHALIGWIFETEEQLRPRGNPISWLRAVVNYAFGTVFAVVFDLLPLPRLRRSRGVLSEPTDEETQRWASRGRAEAERSRRYAQVAIEDIVAHSILYLARRPAVGKALGTIVRSPAMDDAVRQIVAGPVIEESITRIVASPALDEVVARVATSPALDQAVSHIIRTPAMEDAVKYLVGTKAMGEAIDTLAKSPALVDLVTTQSTSVATEILEEVRERAVSGDKLAEALVRRLLRRRPRSSLPLEARGLALPQDTGVRRRYRGDSDVA